MNDFPNFTFFVKQALTPETEALVQGDGFHYSSCWLRGSRGDRYGRTPRKPRCYHRSRLSRSGEGL